LKRSSLNSWRWSRKRKPSSMGLEPRSISARCSTKTLTALWTQAGPWRNRVTKKPL
jgi:hypothetical protein